MVLFSINSDIEIAVSEFLELIRKFIPKWEETQESRKMVPVSIKYSIEIVVF